MSEWADIQRRVSAKWQVPLLLVSGLLLLLAWLRLHHDPERMPVHAAMDRLDALISAGMFAEAVALGDVVLAREDLTEADRAPIHLRAARAEFRRAASQTGPAVPHREAGRSIVGHYRHADFHGLKLAPGDYRDLGRALEWSDRAGEAVEAYTAAIRGGVSDAAELRRRVYTLQRDVLAAGPAQLDELLDEFLAAVDEHRLDLGIWALHEKLEVLSELGRMSEAATLLARNEARFAGSDLFPHFRYLQALLLYRQGFYDEAELLLRATRNELDRQDPVYAMTGWLLGRTVMSDGGPQRPLEAVSFFEDVIGLHGSGPYVTASRVGLGEALAMLQRHDEAVTAFRSAIDELRRISTNRPVSRDVLRVTLGVLADSLARHGQYEPALRYARLAATLLERVDIEQATLVLQQLGQLQAALAQQLSRAVTRETELDHLAQAAPSAEARALYAEAAGTQLELARLNAVNERRAAQATWLAAEMFARAGQRERAAELYGLFARERPQHALVPRALLRIGQLHHAGGRWADAIDAYQECYRRFPRTLDGARALIPLAECFIAAGPDDLELAERTLRIVLEESEVFTPEAPEFAGALFLLGDVLARQEQFPEAIAVLEEAMQRYPDDPRTVRSGYLLAEAFRRSALALKAEGREATSEARLARMRAKAAERLVRARELYRQLIETFQLRDPATLDELERVYRRHAYLYEADCFFETQQYQEALKRYEEAAAVFKDSPSVLAAYVQIINCHVFLGQQQEARAALARAKVLADTIPQKAFDAMVSPETRRDWKRYFAWLEDSGLI